MNSRIDTPKRAIVLGSSGISSDAFFAPPRWRQLLSAAHRMRDMGSQTLAMASRRGLLALLVTAVAWIGLGAPAHADPGRVFHFSYAGYWASAYWELRSETTRTTVDLLAGNGTQAYSASFPGLFPALIEHGSFLIIGMTVFDLDAEGNVTGGVYTGAFCFPDTPTSNCSVVVDPLLQTAKVRGAGLMTDVCAWEGDWHFGCEESTSDLEITWSGVGPVFRGGFPLAFTGSGFHFTDVVAGSYRIASAAGSFAGVTLPTTSEYPTFLAHDLEASVTACLGSQGC